MIASLNRNVNIKWFCPFLVFAAISTGLLSAQPSTQKFSIGIKAGPLALKSVYGDKDEGKPIDDKVKYGYYAAGLISFPLKNHYACVIEGGFSQKGRKALSEGGSIKNNGTYYFVDAALLLRRSFRLNLGKNIPADWFVNVGPHISYWLGGKGTIGGVNNDGTAYKVVFADSFKLGNYDKMYMINANRWLFGLDMGVGMTAPIRPTTRIMVELRFTWGHTYYGGALTQNYDWVNFTDNNMKANEKVLSLTIAYMWDLDLRENKKGHSTKDKEVHRKPVKRKRR